MSNIPLPNTYGRIAIDAPQGGIGSVMDPTLAGIKRNLDAISASINQTVTAIQSLDAKDAALDAAISALRASVSSLTESVSDAESDIAALDTRLDNALDAACGFVKLTAASGGSTWNLADLPGYPYIRSVIVDPSTELNILNLPALGMDDRMLVSVKVTTGPGALTIDGGAADIIPIAAMGIGATYGIPVTKLEGSLRVTEYGVTLLWAGSEWHIIENSVYIS